MRPGAWEEICKKTLDLLISVGNKKVEKKGWRKKVEEKRWRKKVEEKRWRKKVEK